MKRNDQDKIKTQPFRLERYVWALAVVWTVVVAVSLAWNIISVIHVSLEEARIQARSAFDKDIIYRRWNADQGGVYVPVSEETPPNPYLSDMPERDIVTPSGRHLTLINPAYMTRMVHELAEGKYGVRGHITSLKPIRPENKPDLWETEALSAFEHGKAEISSVEEIEGNEYMRLMRPLITEKGCLKCHAKQGYKEGDIRGGISVSIPMNHLRAVAGKQMLTLGLGHLFLWLMGVGGIVLGMQGLMRKESERRLAEEALQKAKDELEMRVEERTSELRFANEQLTGEITERKQAEDELRKRTHDLDERLKELACLYGVSELFELDVPIDDILQSAVELLPSGWTYQEKTCARIKLGDMEFTTSNFQETVWRQGADILISGEKAGSVEVFYLEEMPGLDEGPFLAEERHLLSETAKQLGEMIGKRWAEEALRLKNLVFDASIDANSTADTDGIITEVNNAFLNIWGYSGKDEVIGKPISDFLQSMDDAEEIAIALNEAGVWVGGYVGKKIDGSTFNAFCTATVLRDRDGEIIGYQSSVRDITELKQAEKEKEKLQAQLLQSQKMEAIGQLAGGMAHDFNNQLTVIMGNANLALMDMKEGDPNYLEFKEIMKASERSKDLTMKLLTFARKEKIDVSPIKISKVINELTEMLKRSVIKKINIKSVIEDDMTLCIDANQIEQALMNVCVNACDAMQDGGELIIECSRYQLDGGICKTCGKEFSGGYCLIQISDTGIGMSEEVMRKVLEPFFTTKGAGKGTGLGLSVTHGIILSHKGHLHIYSEIDKGTCVKIYLPLSETADRVPEEKAERKILRGTETILIVDDEKSVLSIAKRALEGAGYKTIAADGGKEAIEAYKKHRKEIGLVLLDMIMPEMDGRDVIFAIKEINPDVKIVLSSGYSINGQAGNLIKEGIQGFVQKPFTITDLCNTVRKVLDE